MLPRRRRCHGPALLLGAALALAASGVVSGARAQDDRVPAMPGQDDRMSASRAGIQLSVATRIDSTGAEGAVVRGLVPYRSLVFTRRGAGYRAGVRLTAVAKRDGKRVGGGVGEAETIVPDYAATQSDRQLSCAVPLRLRGSGTVTLDVDILVTDTSRHWRERLDYVAGRGGHVPVYFAGLDWNLIAGPGLGPALGSAADSLRVTVTLGRRPNVADWPAGGVRLVSVVAPPGRGEKPAARRLELAPFGTESVPAAMRLAWAADDLPLGRLVLSLWLESGGGDALERLDLDPPRSFVNLAIPWRDDALWRQQVAWLEGIVSGEARQELLRLPPDRRREAWRALWATAGGRDGLSADEVERAHLLRIVEADERFGRFGRGALTDRGRIWIRYGRPDTVEERSADLAFEGRWELWYYREQRLVFSFYDAHGLGDYRLVATGTP